MAALQCQRLRKEDKEKTQGDDKLSIGILHLGTERGTISQEGKETVHCMDMGPGERREWENVGTAKRGRGLGETRRSEKPEGMKCSWVGNKGK